VRRFLAVASFAVSGGASAFLLYAMYLPLFALAGAIK
jgi:hypothetical protein